MKASRQLVRNSIQGMILLIFISMPLFANHEMMNMLSMCMVLLVMCFSCWGCFRKEPVSVLLFSVSCIFVTYMLIVRSIVVNDADRYAVYFVNRYQCAPTPKDLVDGNDDWGYVDHALMVKNIKFWGYSRRIVYRPDIGRLNYGFLYDGSRSIKLKLCNTSDETGK
jgi:hypothetical protein